MSSQPIEHLKIRDFSDREILAILNDLAGKASARGAAERIFGNGHEPGQVIHFTRCVTSRFVWMRRYGLLNRAEDGEWEISEYGEQLRTGTLSTSLSTQITSAKETNALALGNAVGERLVGMGEVSGRAMQRELTHQINRRRARLRGW